MCLFASSSSCDKWRTLTGSQRGSLRTVVCLINRKFIWQLRAKRTAEKTGMRIFQANVLRWGESALYVHAFGINGYMCAKHLVAADARKSRQICSHGDSQDVARSIRRSVRRLFESRISRCFEFIEYERRNISYSK